MSIVYFGLIGVEVLKCWLKVFTLSYLSLHGSHLINVMFKLNITSFIVSYLIMIKVPMADFAGDEHKVDCWMDVTKGRYPNNSPIDGPVKVGENLTLAIYIRDTRKRTDIRVKDCYAYDNEKSVNDTSPALLQLSGEDGCPLKPKLMDVWKRTTTGAQDATVLAYSTVTVSC